MSSDSREINSPLSDKTLSWGIGIIICWYLMLCIVHYFNQRPLWNDEECIFRSIKAFSSWQMFHEPLRASQVFPRPYLFFIQKISQSFSYHLLSLRLLPFISMMCAFLIWLKLARYEMNNKLEYLTFVLSWPASGLLIYYSAELKQYSMDVLVGALFLLFLYNQKRLQGKKYARLYTALLIVLPALCLFSYTGFLFAVFPLYNLILSSKENIYDVRFLGVFSISLICVMMGAYFFDMRLRPVAAVTTGFHDYFISLDSIGEFFKTLGEGTNNIFSRWFAEKPRVIRKIARVFVVFGLFQLFYSFFKNIKKERYYLQSINTIGLILFVELFFLGVLKKYPFGIPRTALFLCPIIMFMTFKGIMNIKNINQYAYAMMHGSYLIFLFLMTISLGRIIIWVGDLGCMPQLW